MTVTDMAKAIICELYFNEVGLVDGPDGSWGRNGKNQKQYLNSGPGKIVKW